MKNKFRIQESGDWKTIQEMGVEAGLEPGELGDVIQAWEAGVGEKTVGGIILLRAGKDSTVEWLSVQPSHRKKGIGSTLVKQALDYARKKGYPRVVISMQIPEFFKRFGFVYDTMHSLSEDFYCYRCPRFNKSCFPVAMVLDFSQPRLGIEIEETRDYPLLEKLAHECGQEVDHEMTKRITRAWFARKGKKIIGGIGIFNWDGYYTLDYSFATEDRELVQENLMKEVLLYAQKNKIEKIYYIRGAPDHLFAVERFGFKELHWRLLPTIYRDFSTKMCDNCPPEIKKVCHPVAMVLEFGRPPKYVFS